MQNWTMHYEEEGIKFVGCQKALHVKKFGQEVENTNTLNFFNTSITKHIFHLIIHYTTGKYCFKVKYRISSYSFCGNYSFLNLEIQRSQYIRPKVTLHKGAETIHGRKIFKGGNYMRKYGTQRKLLNFENWVNGEVSKIGHHFKVI